MYFIYAILASLALAMFFITRAFQNRKSNATLSRKMISLANEVGLLSLVIGCLGAIIGLIQLFLLVESLGNDRPDLFAEGVKTALYTMATGLGVFLLVRIGILIFNWMKEYDTLNN